jgi:acyl carrier protein
MNTREVVRKAVADLAKEDIGTDDSASLFERGVIDSFGLLDLIQSLERSFGVKVPDSDLSPRRFDNIDKIVAYFDGRTKSGQAGA